jgi:hypothetical protein
LVRAHGWHFISFPVFDLVHEIMGDRGREAEAEAEEFEDEDEMLAYLLNWIELGLRNGIMAGA